ncbi:Uncharacterised protein [Mycobacterium tuberculosis]|nr:Uncharacterised protein [Mycobacterium tuberculosis]CNL23099.1 Uncharacterised protein [Mycobacterium tuberculosis]CNL62615.1 Uncharacterised protein [Mycobacterium tuberculosis]CNL99807.1 Uncharacterised protein [Mycobacterium tuberculosis]CNM07717.1 Uncharacterised protein [Mycobacterium tuberculosis]
MGQLIAHALKGRLADELGHQNLLGFVSQLTVGVIRGAGRQCRGQYVDQQVYPVAGHRRNRDNLGRIRDEFADRYQLGDHFFFRHLVNLGDDDHQCRIGRAGRTKLLDNPPVSRTDRLVGGDA